MTSENRMTADLSSSAVDLPAGTALGVVAGQAWTISSDLVNSLPPGAFRTDDHRYYFNGRGPLPSVTTILDIMSKPALMTWKAKEAARAIIRSIPSILPEEEWIRYALAEADKKRNDSARIGTGIHHLADMVARDDEKAEKAFEMPEEWIPYMEAWKAFLGRYSASSIVSSEHMVWSEWGYAGTYDLIMQIDNELWLIDIKTGGGPYPEWALQLAAYRWADIIILENDPKPYPMPQIDRTGVLHLNPNLYPDTGYSLIEYLTRPREFEAFTHTLSVYLWREEGAFDKKNLITVL